MGDTIGAVRKLARYLEAHGYQNRHIALYGENSFFWAVSYLAIMGYCGVCFPLDPQFRRADLENILSTAEISLFLYSASKAQEVEEIRPSYPSICFLSLEDLFAELSAAPDACPSGRKSPQDLACVLFTSGTSAVPKAVMLSQQNLLANYETLQQRTPMDETDRMLLTLPLHHVYAGVAALLYSTISGMEIYFGSFSEAACGEEFQSVRPTVYISVPLQAERFVLWAERSGLSLSAYTGGCLKYLYCGGTAIAPDLKRAYLQAGLPILEAYGLSETSSVVALDCLSRYREGSTGKVFENLDVKIDQPDEQGVGELLVRGKSLMQGYFKNPELNQAAFTKEGYFRTGDLGRLDQDGFLFLTGRKKKVLITSNGKNILLDELEDYFSIPSVTRVVIYVQASHLQMKCWYTGDAAAVERGIRAQNARLPKYKQISAWELLFDVPGGRMK